MEQDIIDFDPFESYLVAGQYEEYEYYIDSEPMTDDDWQEWLDND